MRVLVTGAAGVAGRAVCRQLLRDGHSVRMADMTAPPQGFEKAEYVRCDTRTPSDVQSAMQGVNAVVHLAAWHCAHVPPVSDATIFAVNVDGTFNVFEAGKSEGVQSVVYASSMAFGWGGVYGVTKVIGEDLCRSYHEMTGASYAMLRYHDFVPKPYLDFGLKLLRNGVDARDVGTSTVAALYAGMEKKFGLFKTIVHTDHKMPPEVVADFRANGPDWCEAQMPGAKKLMEKYDFVLPESVEQHDLSEAARVLGWKPKIGFIDFLRDLAARDARDENVKAMWAEGQLPA